MRKGKIFQVITALLLAITLVVTGVYHPYLFGEKDSEAQAADNLTEISWEDFEGAEYGKTYDTQWAKFTYKDTSVTTLNNTKFTGRIQFSDPSGIRYGGSNESFGLQLTVISGNLYLWSETFNLADIDLNSAGHHVRSATDFGIASGTFANEPIELAIQMTKVTETTATVGVWVNNVAVDESFTMTSKDANTYKLGTAFCIMDGNTNGAVTVLKPAGITEISWEDFEGAEYGTTYSTAWTKFTYKDAGTLNNTKFTGRIQFSDPSGIRYGGSSEYFGLQLTVISGKLYLWSETFDLGDISLDGNGHHVRSATDFGIASGTFGNEAIELTIAMTNVTTTTATVGVWVNDIAVDDSFTMTSKDVNTYKLGSTFCIMDGNTNGPVTVLKPAGITEISWEEFEGAEYGTTYNTAWSKFTYKGASTLNNTKFTGQIQFSDPSGIRYGGSNESYGLQLTVISGKLYLWSETFSLADIDLDGNGHHVRSALDFEIATGTFANEPIKLTIQMTKVTETTATVGVWVNDIPVDESFTMTSKDANTYKLGASFCIMDGNTGGAVTIPVAPSLEMTEIHWSDFGISYGSKYTAWQQVEYTGTTLNNTVFEDYVMMTENAQFGYAASMGWDGIYIGLEANGTLLIKSDTCTLTYLQNDVIVNIPHEPSEFDLMSFVNTKFKLKIETTELSETSAKFRIWINDVLVGNDTILGTVTDTANYGFGNQIGLQRSNSGAMYMPANVAVPEDLTTITWEEFGIAANTTYQPNGSVDTILYGSASHYVNLNDTLFNGDVKMGAGAHFRYGGSAGDFGLHITAAADGTLVLASDTFTFENIGKSYVPELFGLDTFVDTKFNLKIALTEVTGTTMKACVWVNDQAVTGEFVMTSTSAEVFKTGNCLALYNGTITPYTIFKQPTGLPTIAFKDFNNNGFNSSAESANGAPIENGTYGRNWIQAVYSGTETTLLGMSFRDTVKFVPYEAYTSTYYYTLQYGGGKTYGQDGGIRLSLVGDNLVIHPAVSEFTSTWTLTPDKVGLQSFANTEFQLGIDAVKYGNHVLLWMYFDGVCYNNAPFFLVNFASEMSNTLMMIAGNKTSEEYLADKLVIGATLKTLTSVHHDVALGGYKLPAGLTKISGKTYQGEGINTSSYTGGSSITETGVYTIQYDDGISMYEQTIYLALTGDNNCNSVLDSCDLVRLLKQQRITEYTMEDGAEAAADIDNNGYLSEEDITALRTALVDALNGDNSVMPIIGFREPTGGLLTDEIYEKIAKSGINTIMQYETQFSTVASNRYSVYEQLTLAQNHNIKITVSDVGLRTDPSSVTTDAVQKAVSKYDYFQSYAGLWIEDEPGDECFSFEGRETLMNYYSNLALRARDAEQEIFSTLQPFHKTSGDDSSYYNYKGASYNYVQYLRNYITKFNPTMLTYDYYPFDQDKTINGVSGNVEGANQYFQNLAMVREVAQKANAGKGIPFWYTVQAGTNWNDDPTSGLAPTTNNRPTKGEFKWNVNTALAFGAKGIQYFPLVQPDYFANTTNGEPDYKRNGLLGANGEPTSWYVYAQEINAQIAAIDHVLMNATNEGLMSTTGYAKSQATEVVKSMTLYEKTKEGWFDIWDEYSESETLTTPIHDSYAGATVTVSDTNYGALTGCFATSDGKHALYIVNYNPSSNNTITVNLDSEKSVSITANAETEEMTTSTVTKTLGAGEAMLIVY